MSSRATTLLISNSIDYVADLLVGRLGTEKVFRVNTDLWRDYQLFIGPESFEIRNPAGRCVTEADIVKVYRRSSMKGSVIFPSRTMSDAERYAEEENWMAWGDLVNILWDRGKVVLIQPYATVRTGKLQQLRLAAKHFTVTPYRYVFGEEQWLRPGWESVVKSFSFKYADGIGFYARKVDEGQLDGTQPWFLTDYIEAEEDVTVAMVRDEVFAFSLARDLFVEQTIDWRKAPSQIAHRSWTPTKLPSAIEQAIFAFSKVAGVHYARFDFLKKGDHYTFLEANYSGEWGWLDANNEHGLMAKIVHEIDPDTPCHPCPRAAFS